jgi:hypothetical protein
MWRYDIVSGILLILSIIDFAIAAPISVQEKRQTCVDVVNIPKDVITVLGKRGEEELAKLAEGLAKTWGKPIDSSDGHTLSSSSPPGPDHEPTDVVQGPAPNPASSTANSGLLMEPSSPTSTGAISNSFEDRFNAAWDKAHSDKGSDTSSGSMFTAMSTEYGSDTEPEWATAHAEWATEHVDEVNPIPIPGPSTGADPYFDWEHWQNAPSPPKPLSPKGISLAPKYQIGYVKQLNVEPSTGADPDFDWEHWQNAPSPPKPSSPKEISLAPKYQIGHLKQLDAELSTGADPDFDWDRWSSEDDLLALAPRPLATSPQKEVGPTVWGIPWPDDPWKTGLTTKPDAPAATDFYSYAHPGSEAHPPVPASAWLPEVPEHEEVTAPSPGTRLPTVPEHGDMIAPSPGAELPTMLEHEDEAPPSPNLGSPKEPENEVVPGPPPTPESTDPELHSDPQSLSTAVQPEDLRAAMYANEDLRASMYAAKGKAKESRSIVGTARVVEDAAQKELQPAERSLDPGE